MINIVLFGPPGSGKGTQAQNLIEKFNLKQISTGDLFRYNMKNGTALGILAKSYIDKGELVPDQVTTDMLIEEVKKPTNTNGFIFDGYPRTVAQAKALDEVLSENKTAINGVISLEVQYNELVKRILGRGKDSGRSDDQDIKIIENRILVYNDKTAPLIEYYKKQNKYHSINGMGTIDDIFKRISSVMDKF